MTGIRFRTESAFRTAQITYEMSKIYPANINHGKNYSVLQNEVDDYYTSQPIRIHRFLLYLTLNAPITPARIAACEQVLKNRRKLEGKV